jgi:hypothetical protein
MAPLAHYLESTAFAIHDMLRRRIPAPRYVRNLSAWFDLLTRWSRTY